MERDRERDEEMWERKINIIIGMLGAQDIFLHTNVFICFRQYPIQCILPLQYVYEICLIYIYDRSNNPYHYISTFVMWKGFGTKLSEAF